MPGLTIHSYDAKIDMKKRITLRNTKYEYYHVEEYDDGRILLEPRQLVPPLEVAETAKYYYNFIDENK